jgi:hypothetical protein
MRGSLSLKRKDASTGPATTAGNQSERKDQHRTAEVCRWRGVGALNMQPVD